MEGRRRSNRRIEEIIRDLIGDSETVKVIDFILDFPQGDYSVVEFAKKSGVSLASANKIVPKLVEAKLLVWTRKVSKANLYAINPSNETFMALKDLDMAVIKPLNAVATVAKELAKEKVGE